MNELTITLNVKSTVPLYEQIYEYIKTDIRNGKIKCKEKLPSTRALAKYLEVSRSTVELAYEQLLAEGYVEAEACRGFFVAQIDALYQWEPEKEKRRKKEEKKKKVYRYDFSPWGIDLQSFPQGVWRRLTKEILGDDRPELFQSGDPQGEYELRETIRRYLYQSRGVNCEPEQIIVGAGNDYLLILLGIILGKEHKIAFENPTYRQAHRLFSNLSYDTCVVEMDQKGIRVDELEQSGADIAYVMPSHQYPLGIVMPIQRRLELLRWAAIKKDRYIIEDDYDSEFRYKGKPIPALQGYDRNEKVIYIGTFSRSVAPSIRISYLVLPKSLLSVYHERCRFISSTVSRVDQLIIQKFIEKGHYERHLNKMRALYKGRHDTMINSLKPLLPYCRISGENAGVHLLLTFPEKIKEELLIQKAEEKGVKVYGISDSDIRSQEKRKAVILLGYANMSEEEIQKAVEILLEAWKGLCKNSDEINEPERLLENNADIDCNQRRK